MSIGAGSDRLTVAWINMAPAEPNCDRLGFPSDLIDRGCLVILRLMPRPVGGITRCRGATFWRCSYSSAYWLPTKFCQAGFCRLGGARFIPRPALCRAAGNNPSASDDGRARDRRQAGQAFRRHHLRGGGGTTTECDGVCCCGTDAATALPKKVIQVAAEYFACMQKKYS